MVSRFETFEAIKGLEEQPGFPDEDLSESNIAPIEYYLMHERGDLPYARHLEPHLGALYATGHQALKICGIEVNYTEDEYKAFCGGFAAFEYTSLLVKPRHQDDNLTIVNTRALLVDSGDMVNAELASKYDSWLDTHPNINSVIVNAGVANGETGGQLHARSVGVQIASSLQTSSHGVMDLRVI